VEIIGRKVKDHALLGMILECPYVRASVQGMSHSAFICNHLSIQSKGVKGREGDNSRVS
jgi:hypothetical protein